MRKPTTGTVRRSVAIPRRLVEQATTVASREMRHNFNRLVRQALEEFVSHRRSRAFAEAMPEMARDPAIRAVYSDISRHFTPAEGDGLNNV